MATKITLELVYTRELPSFAVDALEEKIAEGDLEPERLLAWLVEQVMEDPNWAFHAVLSEEDDAEADDRLSE